jgi:NAD(P)-dependent dehydrogenase (short-subunit alcohol dehydrogenase family)
MGVAWIAGAGKGIGKAVTLELARRGWTVAASARTEADLVSLGEEAATAGGTVVPFVMDVTQQTAVSQAVGLIEDRLGGIDLALLNAGTYVRFGVEEFTAEAFGRQIDINVMGTVNCLNPLLVSMRQRQSGHIAVVSSLTAYRGLPYASAYGASKAALTNMCEAMKPELDALGIQMTVIHPGFVKTPLTDRNEFAMPFLMEAEEAARRIVDGLERGAFEIAFPRRLAFLLKIARCLPYGLYFAMTRRLVKT